MLKLLTFTLLLSTNSYSFEQRLCSDIKLTTISGNDVLGQLNENISSISISYDKKFEVQVTDENGSKFRSYTNCYHEKGPNYIVVECYPNNIEPDEAEGIYDFSTDEYIRSPIYPLIQVQLQFDTNLTTTIGFYEFKVLSEMKCSSKDGN